MMLAEANAFLQWKRYEVIFRPETVLMAPPQEDLIARESEEPS
jgi:hypothetical protein